MENLKVEQIEALKAVIDYNKKLVPALEEINKELRGEHILKGVNWVIQVVNGTKDLMQVEVEIIEKDSMNQIIENLNKAMEEENNVEVASIIESGILPFIAKVTEKAKIVAQ